MIPVPLEQVSSEHLRQLVEQQRSEDQTIEYKLTAPGSADSEKIPLLLKPLCSFANTEGGDLLLGVRAVQGVPVELIGIELRDPDAAVLALDSIVRTGIDPVVGAVRIKAVEVEGGRFVLVFRVPKSWSAPHRVKNNRTFYARGSGGAFELDVPQLRQSFLLSNTVQQEIQNFRQERLAIIVRGDAPVPLQVGLRMVTHVLPLQSFTSGRLLSAEEYEPQFTSIAPPGLSSMTRDLGIDGLTVYDPSMGGSHRYSQLFREGRVEFVEVFHPERGTILPSIYFEKSCIQAVTTAREFLARFDLGVPFYVGFALLNAEGYTLGVSRQDAFHERDLRPFHRDQMVFSMVEFSDQGANIAKALRPVFDHVWNAAGMLKSLNYDAEGNWSENRQR